MRLGDTGCPCDVESVHHVLALPVNRDFIPGIKSARAARFTGQLTEYCTAYRAVMNPVIASEVEVRVDAFGWVDSIPVSVRWLHAGAMLCRNTMASAGVSTVQRPPRGEAATLKAFSDKAYALLICCIHDVN